MLVNKLYYGDNLTIMKTIPSHSIDLIYLDPPFNSKRTYNLMYKNMVGEPVSEQVEAFCDSWELDREKQELMDNMQVTMRNYKIDSNFIMFWDLWIKALRNTQPKLLAYLLYMTVRLLEMRRLLKSSGSLYYHCDPAASHYIKIIMDAIFGHENFINEIIWCYRGGGVPKKDFARRHDVLLRYSVGNRYYFDVEDVRIPYSKDSLSRLKYKAKSFRNGRVYDNYRSHPKGKHPEDWWQIQPIMPSAKERLGYPTQKPLALLERIIKSSCPEGGLILDPFCGCGTSIYSAHLNNRKWIGIDIGVLSTRLVRDTLKERYGLESGEHYEIDGIPVSVEEAKFLWTDDPFQFQNWAVEYVRGFCTQKKTRDSGIDGRFYFKDKDNQLQSMIISVKGGQLKAPDVRDLIGTVEKEKAIFGGLISFNEPSKDMIQAAVKMGYYTDRGTKYDRIQFLSIREMLEDKKLFQIPNNIDRRDFSKHYQPRLYI